MGWNRWSEKAPSDGGLFWFLPVDHQADTEPVLVAGNICLTDAPPGTGGLVEFVRFSTVFRHDRPFFLEDDPPAGFWRRINEPRPPKPKSQED